MSCDKIWLLCSRSRSQRRFRISFSLCPDDIVWTSEPFVTKFKIVMPHHEPVCRTKWLLCSRQGQDHSGGSYNHHITMYSHLFHLLPNSVWWYIKISRNILWKDWTKSHRIRLNFSLNVCLDHLQDRPYTNLGRRYITMSLSVSSEKSVLLLSRLRSYIWSTDGFVALYLLNFWSFCSQT